MRTEHLFVAFDEAGQRLDLFLASKLTQFSRAKLQALIKEGKVKVNGSLKKPSYIIEGGERIAIELPEEQALTIKPFPIPLDVLYEDDDILIINKPRGLVVHPGAGVNEGTLVHALVARGTLLSNVGGPLRQGIVHRLDKDTSGCLVIAKTNEAHLELIRQFANREVEKRYLAIVFGNPPWDEFKVEAPIGRHRVHREMMLVTEGGRPAETEFRVKERFGDFALVEALMRTGRTHQIRVHLSYLGFPVVGDPRYGGRRKAMQAVPKGDEELASLLSGLSGQALHAHQITFTHPRTARKLSFTAPLPEDMQALLMHLSKLTADKR